MSSSSQTTSSSGGIGVVGLLYLLAQNHVAAVSRIIAALEQS